MTSAATQASEVTYTQIASSFVGESGAISPEEHSPDYIEATDFDWKSHLFWAMLSLMKSELPSTDEFYTRVLVDEDFFEDRPALLETHLFTEPTRELDIFVNMEPHRTREATMKILTRTKEEPNPIFDLLQD